MAMILRTSVLTKYRFQQPGNRGSTGKESASSLGMAAFNQRKTSGCSPSMSPGERDSISPVYMQFKPVFVILIAVIAAKSAACSATYQPYVPFFAKYRLSFINSFLPTVHNGLPQD